MAIDTQAYDSPCLQRIWCRLLPDEDGAWFMNAYAITDLQRVIAERISVGLKQEIKIGRYMNISDSLHIYGKDFEKVANRKDAA